MSLKNNLLSLKSLFMGGQILILCSAVVIFFGMMVLGHKDRVLHSLMSKLDTAIENMASQLKANQVPLSGSYEQGVFIVNQKDGSMVVDRHGDPGDDAQLWGQYKSKLVYEMQKQKHGWIVYPERKFWDLGKKQKFIRYFSVDELNWILAIEVPRPTELELLRETMTPSMFFWSFFILLLGSGVLWVMTEKYLQVIRQEISEQVESGFMRLSGESIQMAKTAAPFGPPLTPMDIVQPLPETTAAKDPREILPVDEREAFLEKKSKSAKPAPPAPREEALERVEKKTVDPLTINVNSIKSSALKKMIQEFRNK